MIKRISLLTRKPGLSEAAFSRYWREVHGPMVKRLPGVRGYFQNHIVDRGHRHDLPSGDQPVDGVVEFWFDSVEAMDAAFASPAGKELWADGAKFIASVTTFLVEEHVVIPRAGKPAA